MSHALRSPSGRARWGVCAQAAQQEAKYPEEPSGPAAIDGTHDHTLLEACVPCLKNPHSFAGVTLTDHEGSFKVDAIRAERVKVAIDYLNGICGGETTIRSEEKVDPAPLVGRFDMGGTLDLAVLTRSGRHLEIGDYKGGGGFVEVIENPQLLQYLVAKWAGLTEAERAKIETIRLTIIQPKLVDRGLPAVRSWDVTPERIPLEVAKLIAEGAASDDPNAEFTPGEVQCRYCKHSRNCAAKANKVMTEIGVMFPSVAPPADTAGLAVLQSVQDLAQQAADKNPAEMPDDQIRQILDAAPLMRQLLESVEEEALSRLKAGKRIPGLKLVNGRGSRSWAFEEPVMAEKLRKMGIPKDAVYVTKLVSPAQAEKVTWVKRDGTKQQLTPRQLERMDKEYIVKMMGKLTVASESDSRPAVSLDASPLFSAVEPALKEGDKVLFKKVPGAPDGVYTIGPPAGHHHYQSQQEVVEEVPSWLSS